MAKATGAPVYVSEIERPVLADIMSYVPFPGFGPYESYEADHTLKGGEQLELAGLRDRRAVHARATAPGTSPSRSPPSRRSSPATSCSRARSGAPTCPAATGTRCSPRSATLVDSLPEDTTVYPGHMGITTLGAERRTNPFLAELAAGG